MLNCASVTTIERPSLLSELALLPSSSDSCFIRTAFALRRVALAQNDACGALRHVEGVLAHVAGGGTLEGADSAIVVELTCYQARAEQRRERPPPSERWRAYTSSSPGAKYP